MLESVAFSLTDFERRDVLRVVRHGSTTARQRRIFAVVGWIWIVAAIARFVTSAAFRHAFTAGDYFDETLYGFGGLTYLLGGRAVLAFAVAQSREAYPVELFVAGDGVRLIGLASTRLVPWKRIRKVDETPSAFVISTPFHPIVVPKDAFADGGATLRAAFDDALVGKRLLVRSTSTATLPS